MHPGFQRRHAAKHGVQRLRHGRNLLFEKHLPALVQNAVQLDRSPKSKPMVSFSPTTFSIVGRRCGANLLHCRSPFYLCFEHVDNLGAYSIPSETAFSSHLLTATWPCRCCYQQTTFPS